MKDLCPYCRQRTVVKVLQKNTESLSSVQCSGCSRTYELALNEGEETTMQKAAVTLEPDSAGKITSALSVDELFASWDTRLANAQKGISDPYARERARMAELNRLMAELQQFQRAGASVIPIIHDVSAEVQALGKDDGAKSTLDLIKDARRSGSRDPRDFICYR
jgi:K+/H+ antiporter YhaU regulatory subunit KhtT